MKKRILKIRPYNMANFSGGNGYLIVGAIVELLIVIPMHFVSLSYLRSNLADAEDPKAMFRSFIKSKLRLSIIMGICCSILCCFLIYYLPIMAIWCGISPFLAYFLSFYIGYRKFIKGETDRSYLTALIVLSFLGLLALFSIWIIFEL